MMKLISVLVLVFLAQVCFVQCDSFVGDFVFSNPITVTYPLIQTNLETLKEMNTWTDTTSIYVYYTACYMQSEDLYYVLTLYRGTEYTIFSLNITSGTRGKVGNFQTTKYVVIFMVCDPDYGLFLGTLQSTDMTSFTLFSYDYTTGSSSMVVSHDHISYFSGSFGLEPTTHTLYFQHINQDYVDGSHNGSFVLISLEDKNMTFLNYVTYFSVFTHATYLPQTNSFVGLNVTWTNQDKTKNPPFTFVQTEKGLVMERKSDLETLFSQNLCELSQWSTFQQIGQTVSYGASMNVWSTGSLYTSSNALIVLVSQAFQPLQLSYFFANGTNYISPSFTSLNSPQSFIQYIPDI